MVRGDGDQHREEDSGRDSDPAENDPGDGDASPTLVLLLDLTQPRCTRRSRRGSTPTTTARRCRGRATRWPSRWCAVPPAPVGSRRADRALDRGSGSAPDTGVVPAVAGTRPDTGPGTAVDRAPGTGADRAADRAVGRRSARPEDRPRAGEEAVRSAGAGRTPAQEVEAVRCWTRRRWRCRSPGSKRRRIRSWCRTSGRCSRFRTWPRDSSIVIGRALLSRFRCRVRYHHHRRPVL